MFERFTARTRRVLVLAQEEARLLEHNFIGTEHILLGLLHEGDGVAAKALEALGISLEAVREKVADTIGPAGKPPSGTPPFTPRAKKVLELSLREALQLGHNHIGTEHLLLGLVREGEGVAAQLLRACGAELSPVRQQVVSLLSSSSGDADSGRAAVAGGTVDRRESPLPAAVLLGWDDAAALLLEGPLLADAHTHRFTADDIEYETCTYQPRMLPEISVTVAGADVSRQAFDDHTPRWQPDATPVPELGDAASFSRAAASVRVLAGSRVFVVTVRRHPEPETLAIAAARRALANLTRQAPPSQEPPEVSPT